MERLLVLRTQARGCAAEVWLNDMAVLRIGPGGGAQSLPVHEYLCEGDNKLELVVDPRPVQAPPGPSLPRLATAAVAASARLLLPRIGQTASELHARTLAELEWSAPEGELYEVPLSVHQGVALPVKFPRWRWLDLAPIEPTPQLPALVAGFLQSLVVALLRGDPEPLLVASRLRLEELGLAYQRPPAELAEALRARLKLLHATQALQLPMPSAAELVLRPCAGGRLLECLAPDGGPVLRSAPAPDGTHHAWPVRVAVVNGQCHIVR